MRVELGSCLAGSGHCLKLALEPASPAVTGHGAPSSQLATWHVPAVKRAPVILEQTFTIPCIHPHFWVSHRQGSAGISRASGHPDLFVSCLPSLLSPVGFSAGLKRCEKMPGLKGEDGSVKPLVKFQESRGHPGRD